MNHLYVLYKLSTLQDIYVDKVLTNERAEPTNTCLDEFTYETQIYMFIYFVTQQMGG